MVDSKIQMPGSDQEVFAEINEGGFPVLLTDGNRVILFTGNGKGIVIYSAAPGWIGAALEGVCMDDFKPLFGTVELSNVFEELKGEQQWMELNLREQP